MQKILDYFLKIFTASSRPNDVSNRHIATATDNGTAEIGFAVDEMILSLKGINQICNFEGLRLKAYDDGTGIWSIGYGTTRYPNGSSVQKSDTCTLEQAKAYMQHDLKIFERAVNSAVKVPLKQTQFDALVSLTYNIGVGAFKKSTLLKKLNSGDYKGAANQFDVWVNAGGKRLAGLVRRRAVEKQLFLAS
ncbi:lysozyme [Acinetobacter lactucae]|uniref:Lysozyme n=1 Tax=Acinetobacter lactucae TaxID=1785128 RepID=A0ABS1AEC1_9GAMM|nr:MULTISPECIES: lysozyme [Acinetobacter calcoaceticus/baumannii complex]MBJ8436259.1 lysozyme [Acinetobacter lactucae]QWZ58934.1 lysozyme [Acinetobacter pittii]